MVTHMNGWKVGFWSTAAAFIVYLFLIMIAPMLCGWSGNGDMILCKVIPSPLRVLLFSEFLFIEVVGVCLFIGGLLIIVK